MNIVETKSHPMYDAYQSDMNIIIIKLLHTIHYTMHRDNPKLTVDTFLIR